MTRYYIRLSFVYRATELLNVRIVQWGGVIVVTAGISLTKEDSSAVQWCERGGGPLSLVNTNQICPPTLTI